MHGLIKSKNAGPCKPLKTVALLLLVCNITVAITTKFVINLMTNCFATLYTSARGYLSSLVSIYNFTSIF